MSDDQMQGSNPDQMPQENFGPQFPPSAEAFQPAQPPYATPSYYAAPAEPGFTPGTVVPSTPPPPPPGYPPYSGQTAYGVPPDGQVAGPYAIPQPGPYVHGPPPVGYFVPPQLPPATPLPLGQAIRQLPKQYWRLLTKPSSRAFAYEQGFATWASTWTQIIFMGVLSGLFIFLLYAGLGALFQAMISGMAPGGSSSTLPIFGGISIAQMYSLIGTVGGASMLVFYPIAFFASTGIYYLVGKAFGGEGRFLQYCYSTAIFVVPLGLATYLLAIIPCVGSMAGLAALVFDAILRVFMTMGVHRLSGGKATAAVLIPVFTWWALIIGGYVMYIIWVLSLVPHHP
jgi:hypothetical protein